MLFQELLTQFKTLPCGTNAFQQLKTQCERLITDNPSSQYTTALFLVYGFARTYVMLYEDQAITTTFAQASKEQLVDYMQQMNHALLSQDDAKILQAYNAVLTDYMQSQRVF